MTDNLKAASHGNRNTRHNCSVFALIYVNEANTPLDGDAR